MMSCAHNTFITFHLCPFPKSHELIRREMIENTVMKNKNLNVRKVLEGKLTRTQWVLQRTASIFCPSPSSPSLLESSPKTVHYLKNSQYFSQYCLAIQIFVLLFNFLHLYFSANVAADKYFLFIFPLVWGV